MADDTGGIKDPFSAMAPAAIGMHELLESLIGAGFTRPEAMQLLVAMTTTYRAQR
jgi:hypothetical protein